MGRTRAKASETTSVRNGMYRTTVDIPLALLSKIEKLAEKQNRRVKNWMETAILNAASPPKKG